MSKGEATRQRIVEQSAPLFNTRGFAGTSIADVLEATGIEKGGLYRHFESKEELAAEAFRFALASSVRVRTEKVDASHGAIEQLKSIVERFVTAPSAVAGGCPMMNTAIESDDGNEMLRGLARESFADWRRRLAAIVRKGKKRGEIRESAEPRAVANTMIACLEGALMLSRIEQSKTPLLDVSASLKGLIEALRPATRQPR